MVSAAATRCVTRRASTALQYFCADTLLWSRFQPRHLRQLTRRASAPEVRNPRSRASRNPPQGQDLYGHGMPCPFRQARPGGDLRNAALANRTLRLQVASLSIRNVFLVDRLGLNCSILLGIIQIQGATRVNHYVSSERPEHLFEKESTARVPFRADSSLRLCHRRIHHHCAILARCEVGCAQL